MLLGVARAPKKEAGLSQVVRYWGSRLESCPGPSRGRDTRLGAGGGAHRPAAGLDIAALAFSKRQTEDLWKAPGSGEKPESDSEDRPPKRPAGA